MVLFISLAKSGIKCCSCQRFGHLIWQYQTGSNQPHHLHLISAMGKTWPWLRAVNPRCAQRSRFCLASVPLAPTGFARVIFFVLDSGKINFFDNFDILRLMTCQSTWYNSWGLRDETIQAYRGHQMMGHRSQRQQLCAPCRGMAQSSWGRAGDRSQISQCYHGYKPSKYGWMVASCVYCINT